MIEEPSPASAPKLLEQVRGKIRLKHYSLRTEQTYVDWIKRYILFHGKRHPRDMGSGEVDREKGGQIYYSSGDWHGCDMHQRLLAAYGKLTHDTHAGEVKSPYP